MFTIRKGTDRGITELPWLDSRHTFSFGDFVDPKHHQFRTLRVINDDRVAPGGGFGTHPHRDMEIITYVLAGRLEHQDSMGHGEIIHSGEWQAMHAGTGIMHSEFNPSENEPVHLLQIWIMPDRKGYKPGYQQKRFEGEAEPGAWRLIASREGLNGSLVVHQDARVLLAKLEPGQAAKYNPAAGRGAFLHVATGTVRINGKDLTAGDAVAVEGEPKIAVEGVKDGEVLLFDLG
jgi:redox-sensitive bicupin YhaK (pirin superfamily)